MFITQSRLINGTSKHISYIQEFKLVLYITTIDKICALILHIDLYIHNVVLL